jgi:hypothetical protein
VLQARVLCASDLGVEGNCLVDEQGESMLQCRLVWELLFDRRSDLKTPTSFSVTVSVRRSFARCLMPATLAAWVSSASRSPHVRAPSASSPTRCTQSIRASL